MNGDFIYQETHGGSDGETDNRPDGTCPECGSEDVYADTSHGELVCDGCGFVIGNDQIDRGPDWVAFDHKERQERARTGSPITNTVHDKGLTTKIHWKNVDAGGNNLSAAQRSRIERLRTWQERIRTNDPGERNLQLALAEIQRMSSAMGIPNPVREVASVIYRQALDENLLRGRSIEGVASACLYAACRRGDIPRSLDEVAEVSRVERTEIGRTYRHVMSELDLSVEPPDPVQYLPRFASSLDVSEHVTQRAEDILEATGEEGMHSGKAPDGLAGAALYTASLLCNEELTQSEVAEVAQVTEVTIRNRYQEQLSAVAGGEE